MPLVHFAMCSMSCTSCTQTLVHFGICLQRRCYWLLGSDNDIVLVHYLSNPQRQQASRRGLQKAKATRVKGDKEASSQSGLMNTSEPLLAQPSPQPLSPAAHGQDTSFSGTTVAESCGVAPSCSDDLAPLIPSMDMLYSVTGSKPSSDGKLTWDDASRSNTAVQDLLQTWKNDNQAPDLPFLQQNYWQVWHHVLRCWLCGSAWVHRDACQDTCTEQLSMVELQAACFCVVPMHVLPMRSYAKCLPVSLCPARLSIHAPIPPANQLSACYVD